MSSPGDKRVALVLGSGGARGYAHIGVIQELHNRGYHIVGISGSSMGALIGGLQAASRLAEFTDWATSLTQGTILRLLDPSFGSAGILRAEKVSDRVRDIIGPVLIEQLPIPYTAVATDLVAGKTAWLQRGSLATAIRASIAIPGLIAPHLVEERLLADGGILDPLPLAPVSAVHADLTIAVSLTGEGTLYSASKEKSLKESSDSHSPSEVSGEENQHHGEDGIVTNPFDIAAVRSLLDRATARVIFNRFLGTDLDEEHQHAQPRMSGFEVMNRSIDLGQSALTRHQLAVYPPDVLISIPRNVCRSLDFHRARDLIPIGRKITARVLDDLHI